MKSFRRILIVGLLLYNFGFNAQSLAQDRPLKKINWGVTSLSAAMWIPWLAKKEVVYPTTSIVTRRKTIQDDRETVMRFVRSHVEGIAFLKQNKEFSLKVLTKYVKTTDPEFLEGSYALFRQDFISAPYPITKGLEATFDYVAQTRADIRNHKPEEFVDASFITELDKSGFIKKLYEQK